MTSDDPARDPIERLLARLEVGDADAREELLPVLYDEMHAIAARCMRGERAGHTLQPTALVHEAWMKLAGGAAIAPSTRSALLGAAAGAMRRILIDHVRRRHARKRGGAAQRVTLADDVVAAAGSDVDALALDDALTRLGSIDERQARIVELRFFAGLTADETAVVLGVSRGTVQADWAVARAWLRRELESSS